MDCAAANQVDLVDYLHSLGYNQTKIRGNDYWYLSPLRDEKDASFKVHRRKNLWYDHGSGEGGSMIDFVMKFHRCDLHEAVQKIEVFHPDFSLQKEISRPRFHLQKKLPVEGADARESGIRIIAAKPIADLALCRYLHRRKIAKSVADQYACEIHFTLPGKDKNFRAIGFKNDDGGYEIRNEYFKASSSPKTISYLDNDAKNLAVFEGFFDLLSWQSIHHLQERMASNFLVLNSLSFFEKHLELMEKSETVSLFLDHDHAGRKYTGIGLKRSSKFKDESLLYQGYKDLNDWLVNFGKLARNKSLPQSPGRSL